MKDKLLATGIVGSVIAAACCVTPLLLWTLGGLGLSGLAGLLYRDAVLFPVLAIFLAITGYALWQRKQRR